MSNPIMRCTVCLRERDCTLHMRAEFPPDAAKKWLKRTCKEAKNLPGNRGPCDFTYRAGFGLSGPVTGQEAKP